MLLFSPVTIQKPLIQKQREMKQDPDALFCDLGGDWTKLDALTGNNHQVKDMQFFTEDLIGWRNAILEDLEEAYSKQEIQAKPKLVDEDVFLQMKVKETAGGKRCKMT